MGACKLIILFTLLPYLGYSGADARSGALVLAGIASDSLENDQPVLADSLIRFARTLEGTPYRYGARGPDAFDCSGFTCYVYGNFAFSLPASSRNQVAAGAEVDMDSVRKGDLIILTSPNSGGRPGHVGIVTRHDGEGIFFIHSSSRRGVVEDRLDAYYRKRLLAFRRILNQ